MFDGETICPLYYKASTVKAKVVYNQYILESIAIKIIVVFSL